MWVLSVEVGVSESELGVSDDDGVAVEPAGVDFVPVGGVVGSYALEVLGVPDPGFLWVGGHLAIVPD
jgi:hypothetical protein